MCRGRLLIFQGIFLLGKMLDASGLIFEPPHWMVLMVKWYVALNNVLLALTLSVRPYDVPMIFVALRVLYISHINLAKFEAKRHLRTYGLSQEFLSY